MTTMLSSPEFWLAVGQIIMIDILLGGDNAVVIALACRKLPPKQRTQGVIWGTAGAVVLRIILIFFALKLLAIPLLKLVGALLLLWIGVKLLMPEHGEGHANIQGSDRLWGAVKTVIVADFVMSVDNVIAIAGAAESSNTGHGMALVIFGVLVSIPIIVWGSQFVMKLMDRWPIVITFGGMLLGWIAGTMAVTDPAITNPAVLPQLPKFPESDVLRYAAGTAGAALVLLLGRWLAARQARPAAEAEPPLAAPLPGAGIRRILLPVDGSDVALRAVSHAVALRTQLRDPQAVEMHLINVQRPVSSDVATFVNRESLQEHYRERSEEAMGAARKLLESAGGPFKEHHMIGPPGQTIAEVARNAACDLIVIGARGVGNPAAALLGSVALDTAEHATVPLVLVR